MKLLIYWIMSYVIEIIKMKALLLALFNMELKNKYRAAIVNAFVITIICIVYANKIPDAYMVNLVSMAAIFTVFLVMEMKKIVIVLYSFFIIGVIDVIIGGVGGMILGFSMEYIMRDKLMSLCLNSISVAFYFGLVFYKKVKRNNVSKNNLDLVNNIPIQYFTMITLGIIGIGMYIVPIQAVGLIEDNLKLKNYSIVGATISGGIFVVVCVAILLIINRKEYFKKQSIFYQKLLNQQQHYYKTLLEKEEATKKFRHDINNHLYCVKSYLEEDKFYEAKKYIDSMVHKSKQLKNRYNTGNEILNIVINDVLREEKDISLDWHGIFPDNIKIEDMDMCILFSNLFKNAITATKRVKNEEKTIYLHSKVFNQHLYIKLENRVVEPVKINKNKLVTTKKNKEYHGFGSKNITDVVKKYNGSLEYQCTNNRFIAEIIFENIIN